MAGHRVKMEKQYVDEDDITRFSKLHISGSRPPTNRNSLGRRKKKHGRASEHERGHCSESRLRQFSSTVSDDSKSWTGEGPEETSIPPSTSKWNSVILKEVVNIEYKEDFLSSPNDVLDLIGCFCPLTNDQKEDVKELQDMITFSISVSELLQAVEESEETAYTVIPKFREDLERTRPESRRTMSRILHFMLDIKQMTNCLASTHHLEFARTTPVPEGVFCQLFKDFIRMCHHDLHPECGSVFKCVSNVKGCTVVSECDIVILVDDVYQAAESDNPAKSVVSIVEVKRFRPLTDQSQEMTIKRKVLRSSASSASEDSSAYEDKPLKVPAIFRVLDKKVLGQHGGELLLHHTYFKEHTKTKMKWVPGIIVIGTEIIFTALQISRKHLHSIVYGNDGDQRTENKAYIYYSAPKDLLIKDERDVLIESFARFLNCNF